MNFSTNAFTLPAARFTGGFGLIELLVSISIMVLVTTIVLAGHSSFNSSILLRSQAYEIALRLREVQLSAVGVSGVGVNDFRSLEGAQLLAGTSRYTVFSTPDIDAGWEGSITQSGPIGVLDRRFIITDISTYSGTGNSATAYGSNVQVVFNRPNFDARFFQNGSELSSTEHTLAITIGLVGATGGSRNADNERKIIITKSGQISVE